MPTNPNFPALPAEWAAAGEIPRGQARRIGAAQRALAAAASTCHAVFGPLGGPSVGILMYHRITEPVPALPRPTWNVPPCRFQEQLAGLLARGFQAWPLRQVLDHHETGRPIPPGVFTVTFDDAYGNVYLNALPILIKLHVPATVFLATAYLDTLAPFPSDDWTSAGSPHAPPETWRSLTTDECRDMQATGLVELAAHTHTHADFRGRPQELSADLHRNQAILRERFGVERPTFAFPYGTKCDGFASPELSTVVRKAGMRCALTTEAALVRPCDDPFDWGRFAAEEHDTAATLAAKLTGWHTAVRSLGIALFGRRRPACLTPVRTSYVETVS